MAYIPNPEDVDAPTSSVALSTAAAEFRALKQYIKTTKTGQAGDTSTAQAAADAAQAAAAAAQATANTGVATAAAAQATAYANSAALAALKLKRYVHKFIQGGTTWTVPAGVTEAVIFLQSGSTASGSGGQKYSAGALLSLYTVLEPSRMHGRIVRLPSLTAGQVVSMYVGQGEVIYDPMLVDFYNGFILTSALAEESTVTNPNTGYVSRTGAPVGQAAGLNLFTGQLTDTYRVPQRNDGKMVTPSFNYVGGARESHGTLASGDAGSILIMY